MLLRLIHVLADVRKAQAAHRARLDKYLHSLVYFHVAAADLLDVLEEVRTGQAANRARLDEMYLYLLSYVLHAAECVAGGAQDLGRCRVLTGFASAHIQM
jgi:hypothetical protein